MVTKLHKYAYLAVSKMDNSRFLVYASSALDKNRVLAIIS